MAEKAEISRRYLQRIESGERNPTVDILTRLRRALGLFVERLVRARVVKNTSHSFSLLELLFVLALTSVVIALAIEGYSATAQSTAIATGADMLHDALTEGRSDAVAQNTTVEVRIYDLPPQPGAAPVYDALQLHWLKADGTTPAAANPLFLSSWVVLDATPTHSPLIAANPQIATPDATDMRLDGNTRVFHFLPDGSTDLNPATNWFMTLRAATQSDPAYFPANWACITVDATTGRAQIYRP